MAQFETKITLPVLAEQYDMSEKAQIYRSFMHHLSQVPMSREEIKVLSAIQYTADMMGNSDAHIAKELVEMGLRAPRIAFPMEYLDFVDRAAMRNGWEIGGPTNAMMDLRHMWLGTREAYSLSSFRHVHDVLSEDVMRV